MATVEERRAVAAGEGPALFALRWPLTSSPSCLLPLNFLESPRRTDSSHQSPTL